jgi:hypothetical protein
MQFFDERGGAIAPPPGAAARFFLAARSPTEQITLVEVQWSGAAAVAITVPAPATLAAGGAAVLDAVAACFPSTARRVDAWESDEEEDAASRVARGALASDAPPVARVAAAVALEPEAAGGAWASVRARAAGAPGAPAAAFFALRHALDGARGLFLPLPRGGALRWAAYSVGAARRVDGGWASAGATPAEMLGDLRRRLATGSFRDVRAPRAQWGGEGAAAAGAAGAAALRELFGGAPPGGALRVRRGGSALPEDDVFFPLVCTPSPAALPEDLLLPLAGAPLPAPPAAAPSAALVTDAALWGEE